MKILYTILLTLISASSVATEFSENDFRVLMTKYLKALKAKDEKALSDVTTKRFLKNFKSNGQLERVFKSQTTGTEIGQFDLTFKKAVVNKDLYMVNIKNPNDKSYSEDWYFVKVAGEKLLLDEMHNLK